MPSKNIVKQYSENSFYHIYSRGVNKQSIFNTEEDYIVFLSLLKRYLSSEATHSKSRHAYPNFSKNIQLLSYALMPNHVHFLVFQKDERSISSLMRSLLTGYSMYFNKTYHRVGPLFQSRYKATLISTDSYLEHISRYIHLNPLDWLTSDKTSLKYYIDDASSDWVRTDKIMNIFNNSKSEYLTFMQDYEDQKNMLDEIKWELASE